MADQIAQRYLNLRDSFDNLRRGDGVPIYNHLRAASLRVLHSPSIPDDVADQDYLVTQLTDWYRRYARNVRETRTGDQHFTMTKQGKDGRRQLPATLCSALSRDKCKVEVKWVACYLQGIHPMAATDGAGGLLECSHRCINQDPSGKLGDLYGEECVDADCLCWESKSVNQSRGNPWCANPCAHACGKIVCVCQGFHVPPCL